MRHRHPACSRTRDVFDPHHPRSAGSAIDAGPRRGSRLEPTRRDGATAPLAGAVVACVETGQSGVDLAEVLAGLPSERVDLRALEGDRRPLRVVLVVGVAPLAGLDERVEVPGEGRETSEGLPSLGVEKCPWVRHPRIMAPRPLQVGGLPLVVGSSRPKQTPWAGAAPHPSVTNLTAEYN